MMSGRVSTPGGVPLSGATVSLSGSQTLTATTDAGGNYSFAGLLGGGYFLLKPSAPGYTFTPQTGYFPKLSASQTVNFGNVALYGINGRVLRPNGTALNGIQVILSGTRQASVFTDAGGNYSFADLPADGSYTITPFNQNYQFTPPNQTFNTLSDNQTVNFTGIIQVFSITGKVTNQAGTPVSNVPVMLNGPQGNQTAFTNANGTYVFTTLPKGNYTVEPFPTADFYTYSPRSKSITDLSANQTINFIGLTVPQRKTLFDYDGDGKADISLFRPSDTVWYLQNSNTGAVSFTQFGLSTDKIVPADYDGDGKTDIAVYRPSTGIWYLQQSRDGFNAIQLGNSTDIPVPADFDGDGKADLAVYRPSTGTWFVLNRNTNQYSTVQFGVSTDKPVASDYDGDGKADYAVYRPDTGIWYILRSRDGFYAVQFGNATDKSVVGDYDGDGKSDVAVYRPENGIWYILGSTSGIRYVQFGLSNDLPVPADYDGDGKTDIAVFRPSANTWYLQKSTEGFSTVQFGVNGDRPVPNAFVP
jgi:Carboxypeptidase regulatory-like domain/FG-GAP-like repeat/FG-GAP repeat